MPRVKRKSTATEEAASESERVPLLDRDTGDWFSDERYDGQLAVDVYETPDAFVIKSAIAGVKPEDLDIAVHREVVTIRGKRERNDTVANDAYLFQECYWGSFSRSIILPVEVDADNVTATLKSGILMITLPKMAGVGPRPIVVAGDDDEE
ncbi:MAG: Hsp20/alpha crystallin family protein [Candidatus Kerfeldbacteria bacterium]|nr:Hsp20/alpha crystallin family protein [Candidatus Kerfeldbacteria bacterium]